MFYCRGGFVEGVKSYVSYLKKHTNTIYYKGNTILSIYWIIIDFVKVQQRFCLNCQCVILVKCTDIFRNIPVRVNFVGQSEFL